MIDVSIDCAVKLIGTNCIIYPVNSKDLQHIWVSLHLSLPSHSLVPLPGEPARPRASRSLGTLLPLLSRSHSDTRSGLALCLPPQRGCRCGSLGLVSFLL